MKLMPSWCEWWPTWWDWCPSWCNWYDLPDGLDDLLDDIDALLDGIDDLLDRLMLYLMGLMLYMMGLMPYLIGMMPYLMRLVPYWWSLLSHLTGWVPNWWDGCPTLCLNALLEEIGALLDWTEYHFATGSLKVKIFATSGFQMKKIAILIRRLFRYKIVVLDLFFTSFFYPDLDPYSGPPGSVFGIRIWIRFMH